MKSISWFSCCTSGRVAGPIKRSFILALVLLQAGCASVGRASAVDNASLQFLQAWEAKRYDQMYTSLGESYQRQVPFADFHAAFNLIHSTLGPLRHYELKPFTRNPHFGDRYDLIFQRSAGYLILESAPEGGAQIGELRFYTSEADQSPLEEELSSFGLEVPVNRPAPAQSGSR
jgi:hypothetical protein